MDKHIHGWVEHSHNEMETLFICLCGEKYICDHLGCIDKNCPHRKED